MSKPLPHYHNLDASGEAAVAAARMEARAREPASATMFEELVAPSLPRDGARVLEWGCGTAALARRIARRLPTSQIFATDKSTGMLAAAEIERTAEGLTNITLAPWDALDAAAFPFGTEPFDLIISSVVVPYLEPAQVAALVAQFATRLRPGGWLVFVEQDLMTDSLHHPDPSVVLRVFDKDRRKLKSSMVLGLRPLLEAAGLELAPRHSFLWTTDTYSDYMRTLHEQLGDAACAAGRLSPEELTDWKTTLPRLGTVGDFYYGLVYHRIAGRR